MADGVKIQTIQFKRGTKANLESYLIGDNKPKAGEPIFEYDKNDPTVGKLKIGNGVSSYADLPYVTGSGGGEDDRFLIVDPLEGQVLIYTTNHKWENKPVHALDINLQTYVQNAATSASAAGQYAAQADNAKGAAQGYAQEAARLNSITQTYVENKFQWLTLEQYNALTEINPDTFYFITLED